MGRNGRIGPVPLTPRIEFSQPNWKTATVTPRAPANDSRLVMAAVNGMSSERNSSMRARKPKPTTRSRNSGNAPANTVVKSSLTACVPPM